MSTLLADIKFAARTLLKTPSFTVIAVLTLALGIGANTAIFSVVEAVLLRPLPFDQPEQLVLLWGAKPDQSQKELPFSYPDFADVKQASRSLQSMSIVTLGRFRLTDGENPESVQYGLVSANFFDVFRTRPLHGRLFLPAEDNPGAAPVAVLSYGLWQRRFAADPKIIGTTAFLDGQPHEIVGVLPPEFRFVSFPKDTEIWIPFGLDTFRQRRYARAVHSVGVVARLAPGVSLAQAQSEVTGIARQLEQQYDENHGRSIRVVSLTEQSRKNLRAALLVLLGAVGLVLLIACVNVANLLLERATVRRREIAIRAAIGASRNRLLRQLITESLLLSLLGGVAGLLIAFWGADLLASLPYQTPDFYTPYTVPRDQIGINPTVLLFALGVSLFTGIVFGLAPALQTIRGDLRESLKEGTPAAGSRHLSTGRGLFLISEVALSMMLLIGAGLLTRSLVRLLDTNPGFHPENVLTLDLELPPRHPQAATFFTQLLGRLRTLPGVQAAGAVEFLPLSGADSSGVIRLEGRPAGRGDELSAHYRTASPGYFRALGIPLLQGRELTETDAADSTRVAVINQSMARRYWPNENPLGKKLCLVFECLRFFPDGPPQVDLSLGTREVVGVVGDVRHSRLEDLPVPEMFIPLAQRSVRGMSIVLRSAGDPAPLLAAARAEIRALDKDLPIARTSTMSQLLETSTALPRFNVTLITALAAIAFVLAMVGIYGVFSCSVAHRSREMGVRLALGAQPRDILRLVLARGLYLALIGIAAGAAGALALTRLLSRLLFGVSPTDPVIFVAVAVSLLLASVAACYIPARRATRTDPISALRYE